MSQATAGKLQDLGVWVARLTYEQIPENVRRAARLQILNMIAAVHMARDLDDVRAIRQGVAKFDRAGKSTVIADGRQYSAPAAALANAAASMAQDFDDIIWMGHTGHSAVFASLAVAEQEASTSRELITAVVAANEIAGRLGASSFLGPLNGQMWTFIHLIGAAAATAKLLKLNEAQAANALAIALSQPTFALQPAFMASSAKLLAAATPTAIGIQAAYFAREGITGHAGVLEDPKGFWHRFSFIPMPHMLGDLGTFWCLETLTIKTFPGCHYFQTACTAVENIIRARPVSIDDVDSITVETTKLGFEVTRFAQEYAHAFDRIDHVNLNFDLALTLAVLFHSGRLTKSETSPAWLHESENAQAINAWKRKIIVKHGIDLTAEVLRCAQALPTGRKGLGDLGVKELVVLRRRYSKEYRSRLMTASDVFGFVRGLFERTDSAPIDTMRTASGIPLAFPNRVSVHLKSGEELREQVNLPIGSLASARCETELRRKFAAALSPMDAETLFTKWLALEDEDFRSLLSDAPVGTTSGTNDAT